MSYDIEKIIAGIPLERQGRENVKKYFLENPDTIEEVERAYYAYHTIWMDKNAHSFTNSCKDSKCIWCGQTREGVRWNYYGLTPKCTRRPNEAWASGLYACDASKCLDVILASQTSKSN